MELLPIEEPADPRAKDYETLALVVASYRVLDSFLSTLEYPQARLQGKAADASATHYHPVDDWTKIVETVPSMAKRGIISREIKPKSNDSGDRFSALVKKGINTRNNAFISEVSSNIYGAALYLMYLCDESSVEVCKRFVKHLSLLTSIIGTSNCCQCH